VHWAYSARRRLCVGNVPFVHQFLASQCCYRAAKRHRPAGKESGKTAHIECFDNTLRQRCSRLVSKALSFSKKVANHIGALWYVIVIIIVVAEAFSILTLVPHDDPAPSIFEQTARWQIGG
jgi:hypothetical protein